MDDLAPAATERTTDDAGRTFAGNFPGRRKAAKKMPPTPSPQPVSDSDLREEPEAVHEIDVLA